MAPPTFVFATVRDLKYAPQWAMNQWGQLVFPADAPFINVGQEILLNLFKLKENIILYVHRIVENEIIEFEFFGGFLEGGMQWNFHDRPYGTLFEVTTTVLPPTAFSKKLKWNMNGKKVFDAFFEEMLRRVKGMSEAALQSSATPVPTY
ncbi:MAG: hypothetical protein J7L88_06125 [Thermoplasmata archaeon]|nr:hypothetical protein [Thermoplasmata archaeon]